MCEMDNVTVNPELLFRFFIYFARFEYALKVSGYVKGVQRDSRNDGLKNASPDWNKFAQDIKDSFDKNATNDLREAVDFIWENPPMTELVTKNKMLLFEPPLYDFYNFDFIKLLEFTRNVRNNLFHGGKHGNIAISQNTERNENLFKSSLIILDACLKLSPRLKSEFDKAII